MGGGAGEMNSATTDEMMKEIAKMSKTKGNNKRALPLPPPSPSPLVKGEGDTARPPGSSTKRARFENSRSG